MYEKSTRPATSVDETQLERSPAGFFKKSKQAAYAFHFIAYFIGGTFACATLPRFFLEGDAAFLTALSSPLIVGFILFLFKSPIKRHLNKKVEKFQKDFKSKTVTELHVKTDTAYTVKFKELLNDPALIVYISRDEFLYFEGDWIREINYYQFEDKNHGEGNSEHEVDKNYFNHLPPPNSFPSTEFKISYYPETLTVTQIEILGDYLEPKGKIKHRIHMQEKPFAKLKGMPDGLKKVFKRGFRWI